MSKQQHSVRLGDADVAQLKWDYVVDLIHPEDGHLVLTSRLDARGDQGFELVAIHEGMAIFKRLGVHALPPEPLFLDP